METKTVKYDFTGYVDFFIDDVCILAQNLNLKVEKSEYRENTYRFTGEVEIVKNFTKILHYML